MIYAARIAGVKPAMLCICLFLGACKEEIYTNLPEQEANEMTTILAASGVSSTRKRDKDGAYGIWVEQDQIAAAITVLKAEGLPRRRFLSMGEIFDSGSLVGTPFEERARFIHALNEELSHTITSIDGVRVARVHIMIPERERYKQIPAPSSASVTIHYEPRFSAQEHVSTIKQLVAHSVPNLIYDDVAVALFKVGGAQVTRVVRQPPLGSAVAGPAPQPMRVLDIEFPDQRLTKAVIVSLAVLIAFGTLIRGWRRRRSGT